MKKWLIILLAVSILVACSDNNEGNSEGEVNTNTEAGLDAEVNEENASNGESEEDKEKDGGKVYQMGETAVITSDLYDFDYEVTVTDFEMTDEVDDISIFDYVLGLEESDPSRFAVVYVKVKNVSDEAYVPNEMFSADFANVGEKAGKRAELEFSPELDEELAPGEEMESKLVYVHYLDGEEAYWFKYEVMSNEETNFELPNPEKQVIFSGSLFYMNPTILV